MHYRGARIHAVVPGPEDRSPRESGAGRRKILFASVHPPGRAPAQRFRFEQYVDFLRDNGFDTTFSPVMRPDEYEILYSRGRAARKGVIAARGLLRRFADLARTRRFDIVFVQREAIQLGTAFFERAMARLGAKLVFDFDDAIWLRNVSEANESLAWLKRPEKTDRIIASAALVLAGNDYLAEHARRINPAVEVVPTTVDTDSFQPRAVDRTRHAICIGWTGSLTTIPHFELAIPALRRVRDRYGERVYFKVIGDPDYRCEALDIAGVRWDPTTEVEDLSELDIGIMPLPNDEWSKGKCGLKGLSYMALEIPTVTSPVGVSTTIIEDGANGFLASSEDEWVDRLSQLVESAELRASLGKAARETVVRGYSVDSQRGRYLEYLSALVPAA
jgi:glycosyltransferase involved in cell wall biosynthesis